MKQGMAFLIWAIAAPTAFAQVPESFDPALIPNYSVIRPGLAAAGQPSREALAQLAAKGFRTVINLRTDAEQGVADEQALLEAQGIRYLRVPLTPASLKPADVAAVAAVLDDPASGGVLLHCSSANRVGGVWAALQLRKGKSLGEAEAEGERAGLRSPAMLEAVRRMAEPPVQD